MTKEDILYPEGVDTSFLMVGGPIPTYAHTQYILLPHPYTHVCTRRYTGSHMLTQTHTDTYTQSHTYVRLPVIASDQVSLSPPTGIKKDHVSIKAMSPKAGLFFWAYPAVF